METMLFVMKTMVSNQTNVLQDHLLFLLNSNTFMKFMAFDENRGVQWKPLVSVAAAAPRRPAAHRRLVSFKRKYCCMSACACFKLS